MSKFYTLFLLAIAVFAFNCTDIAEAKIFSKNPEPKVKEHAQVFEKKGTYIDALNLTAEQKDFYYQIRRSEFEEIAPIIEKIKIKHKEFENLMESDLPPLAYAYHESKIKEELKKYHDEIMQIRIKNEEKIEGILTKEQKDMYVKIKEESFSIPMKKTPARSMGSVSTSKEFSYEPCEGAGVMPACKIDDLLKKEQKK